jgi:hypothetical protein
MKYHQVKHGDKFRDYEGRLWICFGSNIPDWGKEPRYHFGHVTREGSVLTWNCRSQGSLDAMFERTDI